MATKNGNSKSSTREKNSYDTFKDYRGRRYTGMAIGRDHKWRYDEGDWIEKKVTPDKWEIHFTTVKRRRGHAPAGSGVPVGTEYHWYVLADQTARKLDANNYQTDMVGFKFKLAHKRADKGTWSASENARRTHLVKILKQLIVELENGTVQTPPAELVASDGATKAGRAKTNGTKTGGTKTNGAKTNATKQRTVRAKPLRARTRAGTKAKAETASKRRSEKGRRLAAA